jgi:hypothetical protein
MAGGEAAQVYDWSGRSQLPYVEFLKARQSETSIRYAMDEETRGRIATGSQLQDRGYGLLRDALGAGFDLVSQELEALRRTVAAGDKRGLSGLHWGFSEMLMGLGRLNDSLGEMVRLAGNPTQAWAYEQFEISRDEFRRSLYPEALESVDRAIGGHGSNSGFRTDFRFHYLRGMITLGSYRNSDADVVDAAAAEDSFLRAYRYARTDHPDEAGRAMTGAARAAFVQRQFVRAEDHARDAIDHLSGALAQADALPPAEWPMFMDRMPLGPDHAPVLFLLAKIRALSGDPSEAALLLTDSILLEPSLALAAGGDPDLRAGQCDVALCAVEAATEELGRRYRVVVANARAALRRADAAIVVGENVGDYLEEEITEAERYIRSVDRQAKDATLLGYIDYREMVAGRRGEINAWFDLFRTRALGAAGDRVDVIGHDLGHALRDLQRGRTLLVWSTGLAVAMLVWAVSGFSLPGLIGALLLGSVVFAVVGFVARIITEGEEVRRRAAAEAARRAVAVRRDAIRAADAVEFWRLDPPPRPEALRRLAG